MTSHPPAALSVTDSEAAAPDADAPHHAARIGSRDGGSAEHPVARGAGHPDGTDAAHDQGSEADSVAEPSHATEGADGASLMPPSSGDSSSGSGRGRGSAHLRTSAERSPAEPPSSSSVGAKSGGRGSTAPLDRRKPEAGGGAVPDTADGSAAGVAAGAAALGSSGRVRRPGLLSARLVPQHSSMQAETLLAGHFFPKLQSNS